MEAPTNTIDDAAIVNAVRRVRPGVQAIYRFGSTVTGYARAGSDVDVALLLPTPRQGRELLDLIAVLNVPRASEAATDIGNRLLRVKRLPPRSPQPGIEQQ